jgi:hypothetical protein
LRSQLGPGTAEQLRLDQLKVPPVAVPAEFEE